MSAPGIRGVGAIDKSGIVGNVAVPTAPEPRSARRASTIFFLGLANAGRSLGKRVGPLLVMYQPIRFAYEPLMLDIPITLRRNLL